MKKNFRLLLVICLVLSIFAGSSSMLMGAEKIQGKLTISWFLGEYQPIFEYAARAYEKINPGVDIKITMVPYDGLNTWIKTQLIGGTAPDLIGIEQWAVNELLAQDLIQPLDRWMDKPNTYSDVKGSWKSEFKKPYLERARDPIGKIGICPVALYGVGFYYNKTVYSKLKLEVPETWNELIENYKKIKAAGYDTQHVALKPTDWQSLWPLYTITRAMMRDKTTQINLLHKPGWKYDYENPDSINGETITADEAYVAFKKGLTDPAKSPEYRTGYQLLKELSKYWNRDMVSFDSNLVYSDFGAGKSTHFMNGTWYYPVLNGYFAQYRKDGQKDKIFDYGIFSMPTITKDNYKDLRGMVNSDAQLRNGFVVPATLSPDKTALAIDFLQFFSSVKMNRQIFGLKNPESGYAYVGDVSAMAATPQPAAFSEKLKLEVNYAEMDLANPGGADAQDWDMFWQQWQRFMSNKISLDVFLKERSASQLLALERNLKLYRDDIDRKWMDDQLKKIK